MITNDAARDSKIPSVSDLIRLETGNIRVIMADVFTDEEIVTEFLLNTCRSRQCLNIDTLVVVFSCVQSQTDDDPTEFIPVTTGSVAEFYIQPMLSCVGDVDVMTHRSDQLAIPAGTAPPTQLPDEFHSRVEVHEIVDSEFPGYVYLVSSYLLTECIDDGTYTAVRCQTEYVMNYKTDDGYHGPAFVTDGVKWVSADASLPFIVSLGGAHHSVDAVRCVHCLSWPPQAADWPTRHRNYNWSDSATVDRVVSNGCDVVGVAHRRCRRDEWMNTHQLRLSFSRAEVVLLNSWMPVQQILYHMLRVFVKTERLTDSANNSDVVGL